MPSSFDSIHSFGSSTSDTDNSSLSSPQGITVNRDDEVVAVLDSGNKRIQLFDLQGLSYKSTVSTWGEYGQYSFTDLGDIDYYDGSYYVSETGYHVLIRFDRDFNYIQHFGTYDVSDTDSLSLSSPEGVSINGDIVYIADYGNDRVVRLESKNLDYSDSFSVSTPYGICYNKRDKNIIVSNVTDSRVEKYTLDGNIRGYSSCSIGQPGYLTIIDDKIYLSDITNNIIHTLSSADLSSLDTDGTYTSCGGLSNYYNNLIVASQHKIDIIYPYLPEYSVTSSSVPVIGGKLYVSPVPIVGNETVGGVSSRNVFVEEDKLLNKLKWEKE